MVIVVLFPLLRAVREDGTAVLPCPVTPLRWGCHVLPISTPIFQFVFVLNNIASMILIQSSPPFKCACLRFPRWQLVLRSKKKSVHVYMRHLLCCPSAHNGLFWSASCCIVSCRKKCFLPIVSLSIFHGSDWLSEVNNCDFFTIKNCELQLAPWNSSELSMVIKICGGMICSLISPCAYRVMDLGPCRSELQKAGLVIVR